MDFFDVLSLLGSLAMFLYGMRLMGDSLKENSSGTLKNVMEKVTDNAFKAFILGIAVTALIQSSTATIVITSGLVGAGILSLRQSLGIIVGANVGTTVTGQIIRLLDLNASDTSVLRFFSAVHIGSCCPDYRHPADHDRDFEEFQIHRQHRDWIRHPLFRLAEYDERRERAAEIRHCGTTVLRPG